MRIGEEAGSGGGGESVGEWPFLGSAVEEELRHVCLHQINSIAHLPFQFRVLLRPWSYWRERFGFSIHEILEIECDIAVACPLGVVLDDEVLLSRNICVDVILREGYKRLLEFALFVASEQERVPSCSHISARRRLVEASGVIPSSQQKIWLL